MAKPHIALVLVTQDIAFFSLPFVCSSGESKLEELFKGTKFEDVRDLLYILQEVLSPAKKILGLIGNIQVILS